MNINFLQNNKNNSNLQQYKSPLKRLIINLNPINILNNTHIF